MVGYENTIEAKKVEREEKMDLMEENGWKNERVKWNGGGRRKVGLLVGMIWPDPLGGYKMTTLVARS